jgi:hypothetical protein
LRLMGLGLSQLRDDRKDSPQGTSQNYVKITELLLDFGLPNVYSN